MAILNAKTYLESLDIYSMTVEQLLQTISLLSDDRLDKASPGYYLKRLDAISTLAKRAQELLDE